jgi:hypothetical protein
MRHHGDLFEHVRKRTGMFFQEQTYAVVAAFVLGYDEAYEGGLLVGFREWLVLRLKRGANLGWQALVLELAFPDVADPQNAVLRRAEAERHAIDTLFDLLMEFDEIRVKPNGLRDTFLAYDRWERSK